jgi:hypothetical protein
MKGIEISLGKLSKNQSEEMLLIAEGFQDECHLTVKSICENSGKNWNHQDATNTWIFLKLAQLQIQINKNNETTN